MALSIARGVITAPASPNASFAVTGLGFQPKLVRFFTGRIHTATGNSAGTYLMQGAATSSSNRMCVHNHGQEATNSVGAGNWINRCIHVVGYGGTTASLVGDLVSMDSDGFTINFSTADGNQELIEWVAYGGSDVANVIILQSNTPTAAGSQALTGAGFQPNFGMRFGGRGATNTNVDFSSTTGTSNPSRMSAVTGSSNQWVALTDMRSGGENSVLHNGYVEYISTTGSKTDSATFTSFDADGVTINFDLAAATAKFSYWILMNLSCDFDIGTFSLSTSTAPVTTSVSGLGQTPALVELASVGLASSTTLSTTSARYSRGWATSSSSMGAMSGHSDNAATDIRSKRYSQNRVLDIITASAGGGATVLTDATLYSMNSGGFTVEQQTTGATAYDVGYIAIGNAAGGYTHKVNGVTPSKVNGVRPTKVNGV